MGLDISVYKIKKKTAEEVKNDENESFFRLTNDDAEYSNQHPEWTKNFEVEYTQSYYDWEKYKEETGIDIDEYKWAGESYGKEGSFMFLNPKDEEDNGHYEGLGKIKVDLDKVPLKEKVIKVLPREEVGYQRKGLNGKFYDDYENGKIGYFVWTKAELERYKDEYCDEPYEYVYPNGTKSGDMVYPKDNFQKNIIDKFTEGEDCVTFDW